MRIMDRLSIAIFGDVYWTHRIRRPIMLAVCYFRGHDIAARISPTGRVKARVWIKGGYRCYRCWTGGHQEAKE